MRLSAWYHMPANSSWWPAAEWPLAWYLSAMTSPVSPPNSPVPTGEAIRKALRAVKDPELNLNIIDIGLIYDVESGADGDVRVEMTLTSPGCPAGGEIIEDVKRVVGDLEGVRSVEVELVWEPYWTPEKMDPRVRAFLGF
jgi:metal-sulfur cluster biosynthetic enzyme